MSSASATPILTCVPKENDSIVVSGEDSITRMNEIIERFKLIELPRESGLYQTIDHSSLQVSLIPSRESDSILRAQSHIYYMLTYLRPNESHLALNYLHSIDNADDLHILVEGDSVDYYLFYEDGHVEHKILGHDYASGEVPVVATPGTIASKALKLRHGKNGFAFIVSVLTPEWTPDRCKIGAGQLFLDKYIGKEEWCTKEFLRELIGPNWKDDIQ
jgi:predicted cupin superfamily sugar epimerase